MSTKETEPMELFLYALKSPVTKDRYQNRLEKFFDYLELQGSLEEKAKHVVSKARERGQSWITSEVMKFMMYQKERAERREISVATIRNFYKPLKLFLEMNEIELPWKKISRGLPKGRRYALDRAPTLEEIQKLVEYPDRRIKAIIYTMCSSGIRLGAWGYLCWKDVTPIKKNGIVAAAKLVVYSGEEEQYISFITPEAYDELNKWMEFRKANGENVTGNSWLMRDLWDVQKFSRGLVTQPKKLTSQGIKRLIERALWAQGVRKKLPKGQHRHEFQGAHGFRKFFKTKAEQKMKPINVETMLGHSTGISDSYYRPTEKELLDDYLKGITKLIIGDSERQELRIRSLEEQNLNLEKQIPKLVQDAVERVKLELQQQGWN